MKTVLNNAMKNLSVIALLIEKKKPATLEEANGMLGLIGVIAGEAVIEASAELALLKEAA